MYKSFYLRLVVILLFMKLNITVIYSVPSVTYRFLNESDGLSHGQVTQILQDKEGLIWLSTWNGLNLYDGNKFYCYKANPGDGNPLSSNRIDQIHLTTTGNLWCVTFDNDRVYLFDRSRNCFTDILSYGDEPFHVKKLYTFKSGHTWLVDINNNIISVNDTTFTKTDIDIKISPQGSVYKIITGKNDDTWIITSEGTFFYDIAKNKVSEISSTPFNTINICNSNIYLGYKDSLFCYDPRSEQLMPVDISRRDRSAITTMNRTDKKVLTVAGTDCFTILDTEDGTSSFVSLPKKGLDIKNISRDRNGNYWGIATNGHIICVDTVKGSTRYFFENRRSGEINANIHHDSRGDVWVINNTGELNFFDETIGSFCNFHAVYGGKDSTNPARRIFRDKQGNIWVLRYRGIDLITPYQIEMKQEFDNHNIRSLFFDDHSKNLWVGTKDNYLIIKNKDGKISYVSESGEISERKISFGANVYAICRDHEGNLWLGTKDKGICLISPTPSGLRKGVLNMTWLRNNPADPQSLNNNNIYSFHEDRFNRMWVATYGGGINVAIRDGKKGYRFIHYNNGLKSYPEINRKARAVTAFSDSVIAVATTNGMVTFSINNSKIENTRFFVNERDPLKKNSLSDNNIINLLNTPDGNYAITYNGGLNRIDSEDMLSDTVSFSLHGINDGAISETGLYAMQTNDSTLWITYESGVSLFNIRTGVFENYPASIFGKNILFTESTIATDGDGTLFLPSNKGVFSINTRMLRNDDFTPHLFITSVNVKNRKYDGNPDRIDTLIINSREERNISISFAAADYRHALPIEYAVFMDGLNSEWDYIGKSNSVNFSNLAPGEYTLNIKSTDSDGAWKDNIRRITIIVRPVFTETYFAKFIYLLIAFILFYFGRIGAIRINRMIKEYRKAIEESKKKRLSASLVPNRPEIESNDELFLSQLLSIVEKNIQNADFSVEDLTAEMAMGRTTFYAKIKELLGQTPIDFIRETRIKRAMQLLESGEYNVTEVAYECGFSDPKFFSKTFKKMTGYTPKEFKNKASAHAEI